jgi:hypothetical protein
MFGRDRDSLQDLVRNQHDEFVQYQRRRDEEFRSLVEETREFNREILLRNEKVYTSMIAQLEENTAQTRANTKAVLSMLDRFNDSGGIVA